MSLKWTLELKFNLFLFNYYQRNSRKWTHLSTLVLVTKQFSICKLLLPEKSRVDKFPSTVVSFATLLTPHLDIIGNMFMNKQYWPIATTIIALIIILLAELVQVHVQWISLYKSTVVVVVGVVAIDWPHHHQHIVNKNNPCNAILYSFFWSILPPWTELCCADSCGVYSWTVIGHLSFIRTCIRLNCPLLPQNCNIIHLDVVICYYSS